MSEKALRQAARKKDPRIDMESRVILMLIADRADERGRHQVPDDADFMGELADELDAVLARLKGDPFVRASVDNARVSRVVDALNEAQDEA
ncbi:hypothetical protein [Pseudorhodoplanes sinuspersici]|uniref:Uncharacterized protein n=1 Tax=Pseudorhodoplanes sinuspersici TaxID=1235591 RepID=A0A1W6ZX88_9HYPH|nr:hypothetical protein [Pseudorhodoplanes sinuspersici]ARQ01898.1 hypothetical protein CAK95_24465 [Pseudorhodoplanes sinuspersici]RKE73664.1 hypothetical protein DFP91_1559 [Pseudorhodoplanes sinuspersici]